MDPLFHRNALYRPTLGPREGRNPNANPNANPNGHYHTFQYIHVAELSYTSYHCKAHIHTNSWTQFSTKTHFLGRRYAPKGAEKGYANPNANPNGNPNSFHYLRVSKHSYTWYSCKAHINTNSHIHFSTKTPFLGQSYAPFTEIRLGLGSISLFFSKNWVQQGQNFNTFTKFLYGSS